MAITTDSMRLFLWTAIFFFALPLTAAGRFTPSEPAVTDPKDPKDLPVTMRGFGTKEGVPPDLQSARNVAKKKKSFTINLYHPLPAKEIAQMAASRTGGNLGNIGMTAGRAVDANAAMSNSIDEFMKTIHSTILKRKMYFRHSKISRINQYKYCKYPTGPMIVLIAPDGEDAVVFNYWKDSLDFYNMVTRAMYGWVDNKYRKGEIEWAYRGARALENVGEAYREKDKMIKLIADVKQAYINLKGADAVAAEDTEEAAEAEDGADEETDADEEDETNADSDVDADAEKPKTDEDDLSDPKHPKWKQAEAKLINAGALEKNNVREMALRYYREIIRDWPDSPQAAEAQKRIEALENK